MTTTDILSIANESNANIEAIKGQFFEVVKEPAHVSNPLFETPNNIFIIYRTDTGKQISAVSQGKDFLPMQQNELLTNICQTVLEYGAELDLSKLTFREFNGGSRIEFKIELNPISFTNKADLLDVTRTFLTFSTSYDGSKSSTISLFTERLVCTNGMVRRNSILALKGKNTLGGKSKILSYVLEVGKVIASVLDFEKRCKALNEISVTPQMIAEMKKSVLGYNEATLLASEKKSIAKASTILETLDLAIDEEFNRTGETAFGLLQGFTNYTNNYNNSKMTNDEYIRFATGSNINDKAQKFIDDLLRYDVETENYVLA